MLVPRRMDPVEIIQRAIDSVKEWKKDFELGCEDLIDREHGKMTLFQAMGKGERAEFKYDEKTQRLWLPIKRTGKDLYLQSREFHICLSTKELLALADATVETYGKSVSGPKEVKITDEKVLAFFRKIEPDLEEVRLEVLRTSYIKSKAGQQRTYAIIDLPWRTDFNVGQPYDYHLTRGVTADDANGVAHDFLRTVESLMHAAKNATSKRKLALAFEADWVEGEAPPLAKRRKMKD